ncbi:MAG: hypothetical protein ACLUKN_13315 [Bacilli bacterium]
MTVTRDGREIEDGDFDLAPVQPQSTARAIIDLSDVDMSEDGEYFLRLSYKPSPPHRMRSWRVRSRMGTIPLGENIGSFPPETKRAN